MAKIKKILKLINHKLYPYYNSLAQRALVEMDNGVECEVELSYPEYDISEDEHGRYYNVNGEKHYYEIFKTDEYGQTYPEYCGDELDDAEMYNFNELLHVTEKCVQVFSPTTLELICCRPRS